MHSFVPRAKMNGKVGFHAFIAQLTLTQERKHKSDLWVVHLCQHDLFKFVQILNMSNV